MMADAELLKSHGNDRMYIEDFRGAVFKYKQALQFIDIGRQASTPPLAGHDTSAHSGNDAMFETWSEAEFAAATRLEVAVHLNLAAALLDLEDGAGAEASCRRALELETGSMKARYRLAKALLAQQKEDEARAVLTALLQRAPDQPDALVLLRTLRGAEEGAAEVTAAGATTHVDAACEVCQPPSDASPLTSGAAPESAGALDTSTHACDRSSPSSAGADGAQSAASAPATAPAPPQAMSPGVRQRGGGKSSTATLSKAMQRALAEGLYNDRAPPPGAATTAKPTSLWQRICHYLPCCRRTRAPETTPLVGSNVS
ncbi:MAG: tetratricopeptide repeat protein [Methanobacteriota archaeon]|nr:MAG: tetratricopeptide repeat protein [Euryarchaeota archaeon]